MSTVTTTQPEGTPTWLDLGIPDLAVAMTFYGAVFGWEFDVGPAEAGYYTNCLLRGRRVAAMMPNPDPDASRFWWNVYFATDNCEDSARRVVDAGGSVINEPMDVMEQGKMAIVRDPVGAQFGLWQGRAHIGAELVNEPGTLVRNDLVTPDGGRARAFYAAVFDFTLAGNDDLPDFDFTFLRRRDGHEVGGIFADPTASASAWNTTFEVADTDAAIARATESGGTAGEPSDMVYGRIATLHDPFGAEFSIITRPG